MHRRQRRSRVAVAEVRYLILIRIKQIAAISIIIPDGYADAKAFIAAAIGMDLVGIHPAGFPGLKHHIWKGEILPGITGLEDPTV